MGEAAGDRLITRELFRCIYQDIHRKPHAPEETTHLRVPPGTRQIGLLDDQEVDIAVRTSLSLRPGAKEDDLLRMNALCNSIDDGLKDILITGVILPIAKRL